MKTQPFFIIMAALLLFFPVQFSGQAPNLGVAGSFVLFSAVGAVGNTGISQLSGNVGTNIGAITSFGNVNGVMHNADAITAQAAIDLQAAWYQLDTTTITSLHIPVLGNGETLYAGVYSIAAAGSLVTTLTLDAQGDSNAVFIIKTGGAFTTAATAAVMLINGASACNVFWKAEGAIGLAASTIMRGNLIAHNGAVSIGAGCTLEGRALSTTGAVTVYGTHAYIPDRCASPYSTGLVSPPLNSLECFALFSGIGALSNAGTTNVLGDVGTNNGANTGYDPLLVTGWVHTVPDIVTAQAAADFVTAYTYLDSLPYDIELLYPAQLGNGLVLTPHVYRMNAAASFTDTLYLDAQGNADAVFVIQVNGALSASTYAKVKLLSGAQAKNVYWKVEGAVTLADYAVFCGTIICNSGAIVLNTGVTLNGRGITGTGAITTSAVVVSKPSGTNCTAMLALQLESFSGGCEGNNTILTWRTTVTDNRNFILEKSANGNQWQQMTMITGSPQQQLYQYPDKETGGSIAYYRLKQTGLNGKDSYGSVIKVQPCGGPTVALALLYPNPSAGVFNLSFSGDRQRINAISIFNASGKKLYTTKGFQSRFDLSGKPGIYFLQILLDSKIITSKIVVEK